MAILGADQGGGLRAVGGTQVLGVPGEFGLGAEGDGAEQIVLDQFARVVEVAERRLAGLDGVQPFFIVA